MEKLKSTLTTAIFLLTVFCLNAEPIIIRPRTDKRNRIVLQDQRKVRPNGDLELTTDPECVFIDGTLHFTFPRSEGMAKVTVTEAQTGKENRMSALTLYPFEMTVGCRPGYYVIMVNTAKDKLLRRRIYHRGIAHTKPQRISNT